MREISTPVLVESKYDTGRRVTCSCTVFRMSVIALWAATPRIWERAKDELACTSVAINATAARIGRSSAPARPVIEPRRPGWLPITSSISTLDR